MSDKEVNIVHIKEQRNLGLWSLLVGFIGLFVFTFPLSFIALILAVMGIFRGQIFSGLFGLLLSLLGIASSVIFWGLAGLCGLGGRSDISTDTDAHEQWQANVAWGARAFLQRLAAGDCH